MRKKLIEVALPLAAINFESAREKSIRHGHPSTLHLWWARRPLAACRAVLFASLVDDPSSRPDLFPTERERDAERQRLFRITEQLVKWENSSSDTVLGEAREAILKYTDGNPPPVLDPFCGGGSIPLEAQRLGLRAYASDLNPVAVLITKALIEIPPKFSGCPPVNPESRRRGMGTRWKGATGLAEDVRYYGQWMRDEAEKRIGHLYPKVRLPKEQGGGEATVIAWLWARTVKCPNPACGAQMPLVRSFALSTKKGKEAWVEPSVNRDQNPPEIAFSVGVGSNGPSMAPPKTGRGGTFRCLACGSIASEEYIKAQAGDKQLGSQLMAMVAEGKGKRVYVSPTDSHAAAATEGKPSDGPEGRLSTHPQYMGPPRYGMDEFTHLFTQRQLTALTTFAELVHEAHARVLENATQAGLENDLLHLEDGGKGACAYADAVITYLAFALDKAANYWSSVCSWHQSGEKMVSTYGLPVLKMTWDFAEANPFSNSSGNWMLGVEQAAETLDALPVYSVGGCAYQSDATTQLELPSHVLVSTDPPYYDNVPYADLSDFFYVWLRLTLGTVYPRLFATLLVPRATELVADVVRQGGRLQAQGFFEEGLYRVFERMSSQMDSSFPLTIFYAFRQSESVIAEQVEARHIVSTGWETMLEGVLRAKLQITGTWPMRTEQTGGLRESGRNALASSIVLVCRRRPEDAAMTTRRDFLSKLKAELPEALRNLQHGNIAPVDLAQASIGPGMAIYSRYSKVLESDGSRMSVRAALGLINQALDEVLSEQEGEYDTDTRWAIDWFKEYGMNPSPYGMAEQLSKSKNTSVGGLHQAGIVESRGGKVRLLRREELADEWDPERDRRLTVWEVTQYLIRALERDGEAGAARVLRGVGGLGDAARDLAYLLYVVCERKRWSQEAQAYNGLVIAWPEVQALAYEQAEAQGRLM